MVEQVRAKSPIARRRLLVGWASVYTYYVGHNFRFTRDGIYAIARICPERGLAIACRMSVRLSVSGA